MTTDKQFWINQAELYLKNLDNMIAVTSCPDFLKTLKADKIKHQAHLAKLKSEQG